MCSVNCNCPQREVNMETRIGSCSKCGGDVVGWTGAWFSVNPPPPPHCTGCGAKIANDVIEMR